MKIEEMETAINMYLDLIREYKGSLKEQIHNLEYNMSEEISLEDSLELLIIANKILLITKYIHRTCGRIEELERCNCCVENKENE